MKKMLIILLVMGLFWERGPVLLQAKDVDARLILNRVEELTSGYNDLKRDIESLELRLDMLIEQVKKCRSDYDTSKLEDEMKRLEDRLANLEKDFYRLDVDIKIIKDKLGELGKELVKKHGVLVVKETELKILEDEKIRSENDLESKTAKRKKLGEIFVNKPVSRQWFQILGSIRKAEEELEKANMQIDKEFWRGEIKRLKRGRDKLEEHLGFPGYSRTGEEIEELKSKIEELKKKIEPMKIGIGKLQADILGLQQEMKKFEPIMVKYFNLKAGIKTLLFELNKIKEKLAVLKAVKPFKKQREKIKDPEDPERKKIEKKVKDLFDIFDALKRLLQRSIEHIEKYKKKDPEKEKGILEAKLEILVKMIEKLKEEKEKEEKKGKEKDRDKIKYLDERIKELKKAVNRALKSAGVIFWTQVMGTYYQSDMTTVNDYIGWINRAYEGDIKEINPAFGGSITLLCQVNKTFGVGVSYEHLRTRSKGTLSNPSPPPGRLEHEQAIFSNGILGVFTIDLPFRVKNLYFKAITGAGIYFSRYDETENGFNVSGNGTSFGYKVGIGFNYSLTGKFGLCGEACYRGITINRFNDSAGNPLKFVPGYGSKEIEGNFSGFGLSLGIFFGL